MKFILDLLNDGSAVSSARFLNILGGLVLGGVYIADFILTGHMNLDATSTLSLYYGGVYTLSKTIGVFKDKFGNTIERSKDV